MAVYEVGGQQYEIPDDVQGEKLQNTLRGIIRQQKTQKGAVDAAQNAENPSVSARAADMFTGNLRQTRATREIPSITEGGIPGFSKLPLWKQAALGSALLISPDEADQVDIIKNMMGGDVSVAEDESGNKILNVGGELRMLNKPGIDKQDAMRLGALGAAFTPAGRAAAAPVNVGAQMAAGVAAGGATELALAGARKAAGSEKSAGGIAKDVLITSAFSGVIPGLARLGQRAGGYMRDTIAKALTDTKKIPPNIPIFNPDGTFTDDVIRIVADKADDAATGGQIDDAIKAELGKGGVLSEEEIKRFNLFRRQDVAPLRANISQTANDFQFQQEAAKRSGPIADKLAQQEGQLVAATERVAQSTKGAGGMMPEDASASIYNAVRGKSLDLDNQVSQLYTAARERAPDAKNIKLDNLVAAMKESRGEDELSGGVIRAVRTTLKDRGIIDRGWNVRGQINVDAAEQIRKTLNQYFEGANPNARRLIRTFKNAIDDDVAAATGEDVFAQARAARTAFGRELEIAKGSKFSADRSSLVEKILDETLPPDQIFNRAVLSRGGRLDDLAKLKTFLNSGTPEQQAAGQQAWRDTSRQAVEYMLTQATKSQGKAEGGAVVFNGREFKNAMERIGRKKLELLLDADQLRNLDDIAAIGRLRVPVTGTQQGLGPSAQAFRYITESNEKSRGAMAAIRGLMNWRKDAAAVNPAKATAAAMENINQMIRRPPSKVPAAASGALQAGAQEARYNAR